MSIIQNFLSTAIPTAITYFGTKETIHETAKISENLLQGAQKTLIGLTAINLGTRWLDLNEAMPQELMKYSLCAGMGTMAVKGISDFVQGIKERNIFEVLKASAKVTIGTAGALIIDALDSKVVLVAQQALLLSLASFYSSKSGIQDFKQGNHKKGICKILLGLGGFACSTYYVCDAFKIPLPNNLTYEQSKFLSEHESEIDHIYTNHKETGSWKKLGEGISKAAYVHPDQPDTLVKFPTRDTPFHFTRSDIRAHYDYLQKARKIASKLKHIKLPKASLVETKNGPIVIEEKFNFIDYNSIPETVSKQSAISNLNYFLTKTNLCDVCIEENDNARFLKGSINDPKIGIFDFDCNNNDYSLVNMAITTMFQKNILRFLAFGVSLYSHL